MAKPPDERDRGPDEDLFEDLDQFFAPLEGSDWPEEEEGPPAPPGAEPPPPPQGEDEGLEDLEAISIDIPQEDELLSEAQEETVGEAPENRDSTAPAEAAPEEGQPPAAAESPMGTADDILGFFGEGEADAFAPGGEPEEAPTGEGWAADTGDEPEEVAQEAAAAPPRRPGDAPLSIDNLKNAPPEYAELPGPADTEEPVLAEEATIEPAEDLDEMAQPVSPPEPPPEEHATARMQIAPPPDQAEAVPPSGADEFRPPAAEEPPEPEAVEAAAEHFATGMRGSPEDVERELLRDLEEPGAQTVRIEPPPPTAEPPAAPPGGPSWEEAGAQAVEAAEAPAEVPAEERPAGPRNLPAAFVSGILLAATAIALLAIGKGPFVVLAAAVILLGQAEFYAVLRVRGYRPATLLGLVAGAFIVAGAYLRGEGAVLFGIFLAMALTVLWYMAAPPEQRKGTMVNAGATLLGLIYVPFMAAFALFLLRPAGALGTRLFLTVVGLTVLYDVCAFAVGSLWGNRPLAPTVSPNKSWEGALGGTLVLVLVGLAIVPTLGAPFDSANGVALALLISVVAPVGDLVESAFKRDLSVKDMSALLPGHGGILDRVDAILFTAPVAYYFLQIFVF